MKKPLSTTAIVLINLCTMFALVAAGNILIGYVIPSIQRANQIPTESERVKFRELISQLREDMNDIESVGMRADALAKKQPYDTLCIEKMNGYVRFAIYVASDYCATVKNVYPSMLRFCKLPTSIVVTERKKGFSVSFTY